MEQPLYKFSQDMEGIINFLIVDCTIIGTDEKKYKKIFPSS